MEFNLMCLFDNPRDAQAVACDLRDAGFSVNDIGTTGAGAGATGGVLLGGLAGLLVSLGAPVLPGIDSVAGGTLATTLGTAAAVLG